MTTQVFKLIKPVIRPFSFAIFKSYFLRLNFSDLFYNIFLFIVGFSIFFGLIFIKKITVTSFFTNPIVYFYAIFVSIFRLSRIISASLHKRSFKMLMPSTAANYEPTVTFIIPCKNEELAIEKTITKCFEADYPKNKIEVIVINDGSTDRTLEIIMALKKRLTELVVVNWKKNRGKREGMAEGFRMAKGEIVIQLDSDSYIDPKTIRSLINPFINPAVGGYAHMLIRKILIRTGSLKYKPPTISFLSKYKKPQNLHFT